MERRPAAAQAYLIAGNPVQAQAILDEAAPVLGDPVAHARAQRMKATLEMYFARIAEVPAILIAAAGEVAVLDPPLARHMLLEAVEAAVIADRFTTRTTLREVARTVLDSPAMASATSSVHDLLLVALATRIAVGHPPAVPLLRTAVAALREDGALVEVGMPLAVLASCVLDELWDDESAWVALERLEAFDREKGALAALRITLLAKAHWVASVGDFTAAQALHEAHAGITAAIGLPSEGLTQRIELLVWQGREAEALAAFEQVRDTWLRSFGHGHIALRCQVSLAILDIGLGRYREALDRAAEVYEGDAPGIGNRVLPEIVEAGVRAGDRAFAGSALTRLAERAPAAGTPWTMGLPARCRALMADDEDAEAHYRESVDLLGRTRVVTELARTRLLYGEWLRRRRRRTDARRELRLAYRLFDTMGAASFAARTHAELLATGERARKRAARTEHDLTPQEAQVAALAAAGATNTEIAGRLFVTTSTVEYHLNKIFRKLDITSRRRLAAALVGESR